MRPRRGPLTLWLIDYYIYVAHWLRQFMSSLLQQLQNSGQYELAQYLQQHSVSQLEVSLGTPQNLPLFNRVLDVTLNPQQACT